MIKKWIWDSQVLGGGYPVLTARTELIPDFDIVQRKGPFCNIEEINGVSISRYDHAAHPVAGSILRQPDAPQQISEARIAADRVPYRLVFKKRSDCAGG